MNKRILELAEQAYEYVESEYDKWVSNPNFSEFPNTRKIFDKKFAELIVRDCMDIARIVGNLSEPSDFALNRCYEIEQRIQDRFGVEK